jgi:hypothetical protein
MEQKRKPYCGWWEGLKERGCLEGLGIARMVILKYILKK